MRIRVIGAILVAIAVAGCGASTNSAHDALAADHKLSEPLRFEHEALGRDGNTICGFVASQSRPGSSVAKPYIYDKATREAYVYGNMLNATSMRALIGRPPVGADATGLQKQIANDCRVVETWMDQCPVGMVYMMNIKHRFCSVFKSGSSHWAEIADE